MAVRASASWKRRSAQVLMLSALLAAPMLLWPREWVTPSLRPFRPNRSLTVRPKEAPKRVTSTERQQKDPGPAAEYEALRHRLHEHTLDMFRYLSNELRNGLAEERAEAVLDQVAERKRFLISAQERLVDVDGHEDWRRREAERVANIVQRRLYALQHPPDCRAARKVVYDLEYHECGFGCQMHRMLSMLQFGYATRRTLILLSKRWSYHSGGWEQYFLPLSENCTSLFGDKPEKYSSQPDAKVVYILPSKQIKHMSSFLPMVVPKDLADSVARFNGEPAAWWVGQLLRYALRPNNQTQREIDRGLARMNLRAPYVGIHVRRTDKLEKEAKYHTVEEYMAHVEDFFATRQLVGRVPRRVYVASDNSHILKQARRKYPTYVFLGDPAMARTAGRDRKSARALIELLVDLQALAGSEHLVCTLSSNVGRLVYEMMQSRRVDASTRVTSLDSMFFFWTRIRERFALAPHVAASKDEISFRKDDLIQVKENLWNGYGQGTNTRTGEVGLVPLFKTEEQPVLHLFPAYGIPSDS